MLSIVDGKVLLVVLLVILLQIYFFVQNWKNMSEYASIFINHTSWKVRHDSFSGFVNGIQGEGNSIFESINSAINEYLNSHKGSAIDFSLLKNAVDRHCNAAENNIATLMPVPLYLGLAGTMGGVIFGLWSLLSAGSIQDLLTSGSGSFTAAASGVNDLLSGVALAMVASICGIILTTAGSLRFKKRKREAEKHINTFLVWLQSCLLPELPSDTSDALNRLVHNLNQFNNTFRENTAELRGALSEVNESYRIQSDIIQAVHDMDLMKVANANVRVWKELQNSTDKLEQFNEYLCEVGDYTKAIQNFTERLDRESDRLYVLESIRDFFTRHQAEIARESADVDIALSDALRAIKENTAEVLGDLNRTFVEQAETFKQIVQEEHENFIALHEQMKTQFSAELSQMPQLQKRLSEVATVPAQIQQLLTRMEQSNKELVKQFLVVVRQQRATSLPAEENHLSPIPAAAFLPNGLKTFLVVFFSLMMLFITISVGYMAWQVGQTVAAAPTDDTSVVAEDSVEVKRDTINVLPVDSMSHQSSPTPAVPPRNSKTPLN